MEERYLYEVHPVRPVKVNGRLTRVPFSINLSKSEVMEYMKFGGVFRRFGATEIVKVTGENLDSLHVSKKDVDPAIIPKPQTEIHLDITHSSDTTPTTKIEKEVVHEEAKEESVQEEKKPNILVPEPETVDTTEEVKEEEFPKEDESSSTSESTETDEIDSEEAIPVDTEETSEKAQIADDAVAEDTDFEASTNEEITSGPKNEYSQVKSGNNNQNRNNNYNNNYNRKHNKNRR